MKTIIITGATSGIGLAVLEQGLKNNYRVLGIGRSEDKMNQLKEKHKEYVQQGNLVFYKADLIEPSQIDMLSVELRKDLVKYSDGKLYGLILNAGCVRSWYSTNSRGYEQQFALNHLSGFYLTSKLLPYLQNGAGRVLITSSQSHRFMKMNWKDLMYERHYHPLLAYKQSKLANLLFAYSLNQKYKDLGIQAYGIDPGLVNTDIGLKATGGLVSLIWNIRKRGGKTPDVPAKTYLYLLNLTNKPTSLYYRDSYPKKYSKQVNQKNADRLFQISEKLCNTQFGGKK